MRLENREIKKPEYIVYYWVLWQSSELNNDSKLVTGTMGNRGATWRNKEVGELGETRWVWVLVVHPCGSTWQQRWTLGEKPGLEKGMVCELPPGLRWTWCSLPFHRIHRAWRAPVSPSLIHSWSQEDLLQWAAIGDRGSAVVHQSTKNSGDWTWCSWRVRPESGSWDESW